MKKIIIQQKNSDSIILTDNDNRDLLVYTKEISKVMELSKNCILETSSGVVILKPSEISSVLVLDSKVKKDSKIENVNIETSVKNNNDVIKD